MAQIRSRLLDSKRRADEVISGPWWTDRRRARRLFSRPSRRLIVPRAFARDGIGDVVVSMR